MSNDLKFSSIEDASNSLKFDVQEEGGSTSVKKLISSFQDRKNELEQLVQDKSLSKETRMDYKLELKIVKTALREYEKQK